MPAKKKDNIKHTDTDRVTQHIQMLPPDVADIVNVIRLIILGAHKEIGEHIKWNNPCFYYTGEMPPFDPKEYKREIAVFNLFKGRIMMVFPTGAKVDNTSGLLEGDYKDGRRLIVFKDMADVLAKKQAFTNIIIDWIDKANK